MAAPRRLRVALVTTPRRNRFCADRHFPALRLAGRWLEAAGFTAGARVLVQVADGRLVITPAPAAGPALPDDYGAPTPEAHAKELQRATEQGEAYAAAEALRALLGPVQSREEISPAARAAEGEAYARTRQKGSMA